MTEDGPLALTAAPQSDEEKKMIGVVTTTEG